MLMVVDITTPFNHKKGYLCVEKRQTQQEQLTIHLSEVCDLKKNIHEILLKILIPFSKWYFKCTFSTRKR